MVDLRRPVARALVAITVLAAAAQAGLLLAAGVPLLSAEAVDQAFPLITVAAVIGAVVGLAILERHPRHRIGWLFCIGQAGTAFGLACQALSLAILGHGLPLPAMLGHLAEWTSTLFGGGYALALLGGLFLLVPNGRLMSARWRAVAVLLVAGYAVAAVGLLLVPPSHVGPEDTGAGVPPVATAALLAGQSMIALGVLVATAALALRQLRSRGEERQQMRWISAAALFLALALIVMVADSLAHPNAPSRWLSVLFHLGYLAVPVATGFAVLRYRLYDIDLIIGGAVRIAVLGTFVTAGYVAVVVAIGALLGAAAATWASLSAYVLVALAFQPLRRQVSRLADRVVYGPRAAPYDSLAGFGRQLGASLTDRELLRLVARSTATAVGAAGAYATASVGGDQGLTESWPPDLLTAATASVLVRHQGDVLGRIAVVAAPGRPLGRAERRLLGEFADQGAAAFRNIALTAALRRRAAALTEQGAELVASRRRLVDAAHTEREQVAAAIRDRVAVQLRELPRLLEPLPGQVLNEPEGTRLVLLDLQERVARAIEELRSVTAGVLPALLARNGLAAALHSYAGAAVQRPRVVASTDQRFEASIEAAAYFCCVWAIGLFRAPARVSVDDTAQVLDVRVRGALAPERPITAETGWQQLVDRVEAVGGQVVVSAASDAGVAVEWEVCALLPARPAKAQAASNRSGPKADLSM